MRRQLEETIDWRHNRKVSLSLFSCLFCTLILTVPQSLFSGEIDVNLESDPLAVSAGSLVICGGGVLPPKLIDRFVELGGGPKARIVVVSSASVFADQDIHVRLSGWYDRLADGGITSIDVLHTRTREEADAPHFSKMLETATAVWFLGGNQNWLSQVYLGTMTEERMHGVLKRGGVIGGTSAGAAIMSRCMIAGGKNEAMLSTGLGFLPGTIVDQHFLKRNRMDRLMHALQLRPGMVGIGIDEATALVVRGRTLEVIGDSDALVCLSPSQHRPARIEKLGAGHQADLVTLRRAAVARAESASIATTKSSVPAVQNGTLIIVGGGRTPPEVVDSFLTAAGGKEAPIIVVSNALSDTPPELTSVGDWLKAAGASNVHLLHATSKEELSNPGLVSLLKEARGVWFTGGGQWRLVDAYLGTKVEELFHDVLRRGGVIGGTSAGATIQGEYLVRGNPLGKEEMITEGYERGFGFLPGVAIDQHFTQRSRQSDMAQLKKAHPELVGLGIDEATAMIVRGSTMRVIGQHEVTVFDRPSNASAETPEFAVLKSGEAYDFREHRRMELASSDGDAPTK